MITEEWAAAALTRVVALGRAAEFMEKCVFGNGMHIWQPDGGLLILDDDQTASVLDQVQG